MNDLGKNKKIYKNVCATEMSYEGFGVVKLKDFTIFVENLLIDEVADIELFWENKKIAFATVTNYIKKSELRIEPKSAKLLQSGAAPLCVLSYENQLKFKQHTLEKLFKRNLPELKINKIIPSSNEYYYRNKITLHVSKINDEFKFGFYKKYSHDLIVQSTLPLAHKEIEDVYLNFVKIANTNKISKLLTDANLSEITFRHSNFSNETQLILSCQKLPKFFNEQINQIQKLTNIDSLVLCIADKHKKSYKTIFGNEYIKYAINNLKFKVSNDSFYQVNEEQTKRMYEYVSSLISENNLNIIDAFSGVGTIGLFLAKKAKNITCIEINKFASQCAFNNAIINNINNVSFVNLGVTEYLVNKAQISEDVIVFDPPRSGLDRKVIESITTAKINKIIYISCNPRTLVRDLLIFKEKGYSINSIQPFDMFPQTFHVETVALLSKLDVDKHISVKIELDELDLTSAESKATYA
ncbi:23S rRNA (uracil(1939)-C(5))-methyltransferase RlmD [Metamycoplasma equirhinis]|uniref:23S rRNA (uracil(1939)-C(5))-methyltransferase RlmD n=1 Tax=Metamycoplasma equirhinis TaxID=92402 RepID=UPI00359449D4